MEGEDRKEATSSPVAGGAGEIPRRRPNSAPNCHQRRDITQSRPKCANSEVTNSKGASHVCKAHSFGIQLLDA